MDNDSLVVLWTSGDREVAIKMVFMYTLNSKKKGWWKNVTLIVWGASAKLLSVDEELQEKIAEIKSEGVYVEACKSCSDLSGVTDDLVKLGIDVKYVGLPLTEYLKSGKHVLTF
jgi:hypothetical protein